MKLIAEFNNIEEVFKFVESFPQRAGALVELGGRMPEDKELHVTSVKQEEEVQLVPQTAAEVIEEVFPKTEEVKVESAPTPDEQPHVTKEDVRSVFLKLIEGGKQQESKELTKKFGATKLSELKPQDYAAVYAEASGML